MTNGCWKQVSGPLPRWKTLNKVWETWCRLVRVETNEDEATANTTAQFLRFKFSGGKTDCFTAQLDRPVIRPSPWGRRRHWTRVLPSVVCRVETGGHQRPCTVKHQTRMNSAGFNCCRVEQATPERKTSRQKEISRFLTLFFLAQATRVGSACCWSLTICLLVLPTHGPTHTRDRKGPTTNVHFFPRTQSFLFDLFFKIYTRKGKKNVNSILFGNISKKRFWPLETPGRETA